MEELEMNKYTQWEPRIKSEDSSVHVCMYTR